MQILVQESKSGAYLNEAGTWIAEPARARVFPSLLAAMDYCIRRQLWDANLVFQLTPPGRDMVIPLARSMESSLRPDSMANDR